MMEQYIDLCAALNYARTYNMPYPREWVLLKQELQLEWCHKHEISIPVIDTFVDMRVTAVSDGERKFSADAYTKLMSHSNKTPGEKQVPWWDFFLKLQ